MQSREGFVVVMGDVIGFRAGEREIEMQAAGIDGGTDLVVDAPPLHHDRDVFLCLRPQ